MCCFTSNHAMLMSFRLVWGYKSRWLTSRMSTQCGCRGSDRLPLFPHPERRGWLQSVREWRRSTGPPGRVQVLPGRSIVGNYRWFSTVSPTRIIPYDNDDVKAINMCALRSVPLHICRSFIRFVTLIVDPRCLAWILECLSVINCERLFL